MFLLSLRTDFLNPGFNDAMHRFGLGCDFFSIYAAGVKGRLGESVYTIGGHVEQVPYAYAFRYAPIVGLRRQATVNGTTTDSILDGSNVVRVRRNGVNLATYLQGARGPEYRRDDSAGTVKWYLYDGLGSVLGEVDQNGNVTASRKYDVYGAVRATTGTGTSDHKFVGSLGHPSDGGTGLVYMRARYYDPVTGRFASEDQVRDGSNWFLYGAANPVNVSDRNGCTGEHVRAILSTVQEPFAFLFGCLLAATAALGEDASGALLAYSVVLAAAAVGAFAIAFNGMSAAGLMDALKGSVGAIAACVATLGCTKGLQAYCGGWARLRPLRYSPTLSRALVPRSCRNCSNAD